MPNVKDLDLLNRSLSGDWKSRVELFKKFVWDSSRVRRLGAQYHGMDDFLHDCFTNVLRARQSFDGEESLAVWVERVAAGTALERQRARADVPGANGSVRLSSAIEAEETRDPAPRTSYVPPRSSPGDSLSARLATIVGDQQFSLLKKRTSSNSGWEELAGVAGKPLNTIGPLVVRAVDRLARFFGAPPPLNDDLEPVFEAIVREDARATHSDPSKPKGRILSMQLDPGFYSVTADLRKIGLNVPQEVRTLALWDAARANTPPPDAMRDHLAKCNYCADMLRAMLLMDRALKSGPEADFLLCPGGFSLLSLGDETSPTFDRHLDECPVCRNEQAQYLGAAEMGTESKPGGLANLGSGGGWGIKIGWIAAAVVLLAVLYFVGQHYSSANREVVSTPVQDVAEPPPPSVAMNPRYSDLAQPIPIEDKRMLASVSSRDLFTVNEAILRLKSHQVTEAMLLVAPLTANDSGALMLHAIGQFNLQAAAEGYREMLKSEAMSPRNSFRCWAALQCAIMVGDKKVVDQEVSHLSSDPEYAARAKDLAARMKARG